VVEAARLHDLGKAHPQWQAALPDRSGIPDALLAKTPRIGAVDVKGDASAVRATFEELRPQAHALPDEPRRRGREDVVRLRWAIDDKLSDTEVKTLLDLAGVRWAGHAPFRPGLRHEVASALAIFTGVAQRVAAVNKVAKLLEVPEEELNRLVARAAKDKKDAPKSAGGAEPAAKPDESAKKLVVAQNPNAILLSQLALADAEVLYWLRETDCEEILSEVPGTELLAILWRSRYDPLDEFARTAFMAGQERHIEAAFSMLLARKRPPGGMLDARQTLDALDVTRLQNLVQRTKGQLRHSGLSAQEMEVIQHRVMELNSRLKESLDRLRGPPNSPPASSQK
jgi:hypothetical protein